MTDLETGISPYLESMLLTELKWRLDAEVEWQNQKWQNQLTLSSNSLPRLGGDIDMREVKNAALGIKGMVAGIKKAMADAQSAFEPEARIALENASKLKGAAVDLKEANKMVEEVLGETGSNFHAEDGQTYQHYTGYQTLSTSPSQVSEDGSAKTTEDGVTLNKDRPPDGPANGVTVNEVQK